MRIDESKSLTVAYPASVSAGSPGAEPQPAQGAAEPFSEIGPETVAPAFTCRCGAGAHASRLDRCANGHTRAGYAGPALVTGASSELFWAAADAERQAIVHDVLADKGHTPADAPRALVIAVNGLAQATLVRDSAFQRVVESTGPLTAADRERRANAIWDRAATQVTNHLRVVGVDRVARRVPTLAEVMNGE